ncbi:MAG: FHA domain-containing protein, partial [Myxococcota bacterium]
MGCHEVYVVLAQGSGSEVRMRPGDLVGRLRSADLRIDDPRVSEAHAYVSLREGALRLLALRGGLAVDGRLLREVSLTQGQRILLAKGPPPVELTVRDVVHPQVMLALRGGGFDDEVLTGRCLSILGPAPLSLVEGYRPTAHAVLWTNGEGWMIRLGDEAPRTLVTGLVLPVANAQVEVVEVALRKAHTT